jgi:hypothetical protein
MPPPPLLLDGVDVVEIPRAEELALPVPDTLEFSFFWVRHARLKGR